MLYFKILMYQLWRFFRRLRGNTRVLSVVLEFPDLPPMDDAMMEYIERLTANPTDLEFGSLSHYISGQSHGRANIEGSSVIRLGPVLPPWNDLFDPPPEDGLPPVVTGYSDFDVKPIIERRLRRQLLQYDILLLFYGGLLPQNAHAAPTQYTLTERFLWMTWRRAITKPRVKIGLPVLEAGYTSTICHELFHCLQYDLAGLSTGDHAPFIEGQEAGHAGAQRNRWHNLASAKRWGVHDPYFQSLAVGVSAYNCNRFGWYQNSERLTLTAPVTNRLVRLRATTVPPGSAPVPSVYICEIDTSGLANHPEGYVLEARARRGYDANLHDSGVLIHKLDTLGLAASVGQVPFLLGPLPPSLPGNADWHKYVWTSGEVFEREGIRIEVTNVITDSEGIPEVFDLDITVG